MNRPLKRKRRYSDNFDADASESPRCSKKTKYEEDESEKSDPVDAETAVFSSPPPVVPFADDLDRPSSSLCRSDPATADEADADDDEPCDICELERQSESDADVSRRSDGEQLPVVRSSSDYENDDAHDLSALASEMDEFRERGDFLSSPRSSNFSSNDDRLLESAISSPVAESVIDSEFENELEEEAAAHDDDEPREECHIGCYIGGGRARSFMGQLTPGSSICKSTTTRDAECQSWTNLRESSAEYDEPQLECPVPQLPWARREEFWQVMCRKDELSLKTRDAELFNFQQHLRPRMRVILLDWLSEVAEVCKLHRETYYLTVDYIDRYLSCVENIPKTQLQLIGITCLALASKMEEIYPPKMDLFAEMTANTYSVNDILAMEVVILKRLNWVLSPITVNNWLQMMLQFIYRKEKQTNNMLAPQFSSTLFKRLCQLLDLVTLDITSLRFSYGVLVASAIYILVNPELALYTSGLNKEILEPCVQWMTVYWNVLRKTHSPEIIDVNDLLKDDREIYFRDQNPELQTYSKNTMQLYDSVQEQFELLAAEKESKSDVSHILTPPSSSSKSAATIIGGGIEEDAR